MAGRPGKCSGCAGVYTRTDEVVECGAGSEGVTFKRRGLAEPERPPYNGDGQALSGCVIYVDAK